MSIAVYDKYHHHNIMIICTNINDLTKETFLPQCLLTKANKNLGTLVILLLTWVYLKQR